jgi:hypothetical protein
MLGLDDALHDGTSLSQKAIKREFFKKKAQYDNNCFFFHTQETKRFKLFAQNPIETNKQN